MSAHDDGGPAFPHFKQGLPVAGSLSLRDWFAGQALAGYLARGEPIGAYENAAIISYRQADAMLAARKGGSK